MSGTAATGKYAKSSNVVAKRSIDMTRDDADNVSCDAEDEEDDYMDVGVTAQTSVSKLDAIKAAHTSRKKVSTGDAMVKALTTMTNSVMELTSNSRYQTPAGNMSVSSMSNGSSSAPALTTLDRVMNELSGSITFEEEFSADERILIKGIFVTNANNECSLYLYLNANEKSVFLQKLLRKASAAENTSSSV
jgi:hypothetical protein